MTNIKQKVDEMAKAAGFDCAKYLGKKGIFDIYTGDFILGENDEMPMVGLPLFLLENDGDVRYANDIETSTLMSMLSNEE